MAWRRLRWVVLRRHRTGARGAWPPSRARRSAQPLHPQGLRRYAGQALFIPHMEMSHELYQKIDWEAKLDRGAENFDMLMEDGRKRAREFLEARKRVVEAAQHRVA
jgi:hypothetical protein